MTRIAARQWGRWIVVPLVAAGLMAAQPTVANDIGPPRWDVIADVPYRPYQPPVPYPVVSAIDVDAIMESADEGQIPALDAMIAFARQAWVRDLMPTSWLEHVSASARRPFLVGLALLEAGERETAAALAQALITDSDPGRRLAGQMLAYALGGPLPDRPRQSRFGALEPEIDEAWREMLGSAVFTRIWLALNAADTQGALQVAAQGMDALDPGRGAESFFRQRYAYGNEGHRWSDLVVSALRDRGHLAEAASVVVQAGLLERCFTSSTAVGDLVASLATAGRWSEAEALMAGSDLHCLHQVLSGDTTLTYLRAGRRAELGAVITSVLAARTNQEPATGADGPDVPATLALFLATHGFTQQAIDLLDYQRRSDHSLGEEDWAPLAVGAIISGDQAMVHRFWAALDMATDGDPARIAEYVAVAALRSDPGGPWRARAEAWLGLDAELLDAAAARTITLLSPDWVVGDPALSRLVRTSLERGIEQSPSVDQRQRGQLGRAVRRVELLLAAGAKDDVLHQLETGLTYELPLLIAAAEASTGWLEDAAFLSRLMDVAEARLMAPVRPGPDVEEHSARRGACMVAVVALDLAQTRAEAVRRLSGGAGLARDPLLQLCRLRAVSSLAMQGDRSGALDMVRLIEIPLLRTLAEAWALATPLSPEWQDWNARMNRNGLRPVSEASSRTVP